MTHGDVDALETLADMFTGRDYITVLVMRAEHPAGLTVGIRHGWMSEDIYAHDGWFWRTCADPIAPITDPRAAAAAIAHALGTGPRTGWPGLPAGSRDRDVQDRSRRRRPRQPPQE